MSLAQALNSLPRRRLLDGPTPIRRLHGIENALGSSSNRVQIYAKRDDLMSLGGGGNKLRKLEFLLGDAAAAGADTIIATGGRQSNFARLACELVLSRMVPRGGDEYDRNGNVLLDDLFGARIHDLPAGVDSTHFAQERAEELRVAGHITYVATLGGSSPIGCVGYADCALEIQTQSNDLDVSGQSPKFRTASRRHDNGHPERIAALFPDVQLDAILADVNDDRSVALPSRVSRAS